MDGMDLRRHRVVRVRKINDIEPVGDIYVPVGLHIPAVQYSVGTVKPDEILSGPKIGLFLMRISSGYVRNDHDRRIPAVCLLLHQTKHLIHSVHGVVRHIRGETDDLICGPSLPPDHFPVMFFGAFCLRFDPLEPFRIPYPVLPDLLYNFIPHFFHPQMLKQHISCI